MEDWLSRSNPALRSTQRFDLRMIGLITFGKSIDCMNFLVTFSQIVAWVAQLAKIQVVFHNTTVP